MTHVTTSTRLPPPLVGPWPDRPRMAAREDGCTGPGTEHVFPSGRAAILACLRLAGIGSASIVATPECVSSCVADAMRGRARPAPFRAALGRQPAAAIVYEQWGWPLPPPAQDAVRERFGGAPIIVDRVDSADFFSARRDFGDFEVLSLSKVLGIDAGGIARRARTGALLHFEPPVTRHRAPGEHRQRLLSHPAVRELFKQSDHVHPAALRWLADNCAVAALAAECRARSAAARLILDSALSTGWPAWMANALQSGAGPVWAPVLRGSDARVQRHAIATLADQWHIHAAVRMFNWTGNPLVPCFEPALALPIHGAAQLSPAVLSSLQASD